jgi:RNA polymerase sigma factor (sigma-70 family)
MYMTRQEFEHIAAQLRQKVLRISTQFFASHQDAEDAAQESMIQLWRYCEQIDASRNIEALAVRVAKNCCVSMYRRQRHTADIDQQTLKNATNDASPQEQLEAKDTQRMLNEALSLLKPRERELFDMRAAMGLSNDEISSQTGIPKTSIAPMVSEARKKVMAELIKRMKQ